MTRLTSGDLLADIVVDPPGPRSRHLAAQLQKYESPNVTFVSEDLPIFWREARGSNVMDVDGNVYVDLTAGFGAAASGHRNPAITETVHQQLFRLQHGLGDVHPPSIKVKLLKRLSEVTPANLSVGVLATSGAEAVEVALKTAVLASGRSGVVYFGGAYHGLTYGTLALTDRQLFREPFAEQLGLPTLCAPFPHPYRPPEPLAGAQDPSEAALDWLDQALDSPAGRRIGAVIVEPIQGRGGVVVPPAGFLPGLRDLCSGRDIVLILDEILTGMGRTGRWFACEHEDVAPDLLCLGKALSGAFPFSACMGTPSIMSAWPPSNGEAIHTSTFLGHPLGCSAAIAQIGQLKARNLVPRAAELGAMMLERLGELVGQHGVGDVRGLGLLIGLDLVRDTESREPDPDRAQAVLVRALRRGLLLIAGGPHGNVLTLTPAYTISREQLDFAIDVLKDCLASD